jgi:hypothetical protein
MPKSKQAIVPRLDSRIHVIRGERVMLDADLAEVYGVSTKTLNQAVKRNAQRFPEGFAFQLMPEEVANLRSQFVTSSSGHGGRRYLPWVYTEHGAIMAATILNSPRAVEMSVFVVRAFVRLREAAGNYAELSARLAALERKVAGHDQGIREMFKAIRTLIQPPAKPRRQIGFGRKNGA